MKQKHAQCRVMLSRSRLCWQIAKPISETKTGVIYRCPEGHQFNVSFSEIERSGSDDPIPRDVRQTQYRAVARNSDPETSKAAAKALDPAKLASNQEAVLRIFRDQKRLTDGEVADEYEQAIAMFPKVFPQQSPSGLRTRRRELVDGGILKDSGETKKMPLSRMKSIVWELVAK